MRVKESFTADLHLLSIWCPESKSYIHYVKCSYIREIYINSCHQGNTNENYNLIPPRNFTNYLQIEFTRFGQGLYLIVTCADIETYKPGSGWFCSDSEL